MPIKPNIVGATLLLAMSMGDAPAQAAPPAATVTYPSSSAASERLSDLPNAPWAQSPQHLTVMPSPKALPPRGAGPGAGEGEQHRQGPDIGIQSKTSFAGIGANGFIPSDANIAVGKTIRPAPVTSSRSSTPRSPFTTRAERCSPARYSSIRCGPRLAVSAPAARRAIRSSSMTALLTAGWLPSLAASHRPITSASRYRKPVIRAAPTTSIPTRSITILTITPSSASGQPRAIPRILRRTTCSRTGRLLSAPSFVPMTAPR